MPGLDESAPSMTHQRLFCAEGSNPELGTLGTILGLLTGIGVAPWHA